MLWFKKNRKNRIKSELEWMIKYDKPDYLDLQYREMLSSVNGKVRYDKYEWYVLEFDWEEYRFWATDLLVDVLENMQERFELWQIILMIPPYKE